MAKQQSKPAPQIATKPKPKPKPVAQGPSFLKFLIAREQYMDWALIGGLYIAILIFLKIYYPYPQTETDSGNYILSAVTGKINGYRPYGYSGFLSFFKGFSSDICFITTWQWFITFLSVSFFLFTIRFIFRDMPRVAFYILAVIAILNPSVIFMDSYVMSDSLFTSLTLLFITTCIWIIYNGSYVAIATNLIISWWCMDTRYIGLFYPVLTAAAVVWAFWGRFRWVSLAAGLVPLLLLFAYYSSASDKMKEEFGVDTFSSFGGWQKANNGVSVLPYVKVDPNEITDPQIRAIHQTVRQFPDSFFNTESIMATSFMWTKTYPGKLCLMQYIQQTGTPYLKSWTYMGTLMGQYGDFLQSHYRGAYISHYIWPNFKNVFEVYPIADFKEFNTDANMKAIFTSDRDHYDYKKQVFKPLTGVRKAGDAIVWIVLVLSVLAGLIMLKKLNWTIQQKLVAGFMVVFIGAFAGASTIAAPINNFRYMMPMLYCQLTIPVLVIATLIRSFQTAPKTTEVA
jgi:hypothetical protein